MGAVRVIGGSLVRRKMLGERMKGKIIVKVSGAMLVFFGFYTIVFLIATRLVAHSPGRAIEIWYFTLLLSMPLFIISGGALFFSQKWTRKLGLVSYMIALSHLFFFYGAGYLFSRINKYPFNFLNEQLIFMIIVIFFIVVLTKECTRGESS